MSSNPVHHGEVYSSRHYVTKFVMLASLDLDYSTKGMLASLDPDYSKKGMLASLDPDYSTKGMLASLEPDYSKTSSSNILHAKSSELTRNAPFGSVVAFRRIRIMVFNATFNNISVISWWSVVLMDETGVPGENHRPAASS